MHSLTLFDRALFSLRPGALWAPPDPHSLVRSRAFMAPNGSMRLPVNASVRARFGTGPSGSEMR